MKLFVPAFLTLLLPGSCCLQAASWAALKNKPPLSITWPELLLTDGSVMVLSSSDYQTWLRFTPNAQGDYASGTWTILGKMITPRLDFASQVLPNGKVWIMGGEYSGYGIPSNEGYFAEIYDPAANAATAWTPAAPFPDITGCTAREFGGAATSGQPVLTNIISTAGWQPGWVVTRTSGPAVPSGATIVSVDSPTQVHLSANAPAAGGVAFTLNPQIAGNTTTGSRSITGIASTGGILAGFPISGPGIPSGATVTAVNSASALTISQNATATASGVALSLTAYLPEPSCAGDMISILLPGGKILTGERAGNTSYLYDPAADSWTQGAAKVYNSGYGEEGWGRLADGTVITYDIGYSNTKGAGYAERYDPVANKWSPISPADGTAKGVLPLLSSAAVGSELGPLMRLQDDRIFAIGGNGHTALYTPSTNTWAAGPDMMGTLGGQPFLYAADDAPAAALPNGHVLFSGDAGNGVASSGTTLTGSPIVTGIPSTAQFVVGWTVSGPGIASGATIKSIDSVSQVTLSAAATATASGIALKFGSTFAKPTQIFDYDPAANTISPVSPALIDSNLNSEGYSKMMLMLPTGQVLFFDGSSFYIYTPDGVASPSLLPQISSIAAKSGGGFTLTGSQLNGQSAGAAYGDDEQNDTSFPIVSLTSASGNAYYAKSTNWSYIGVASGPFKETVDFTLNSQIAPGTYSLIVSGAGIQSNPIPVTLSSDLQTINLALQQPSISAVEVVGGSRTSLAPGQWAAIYGQNLANSSRPWGNSDFAEGTAVGSPLPTSLDGVSVTVGGKSAAVYYISPSQIDFLVPSGLAPGAAAAVVNNNGAANSPFNTTIAQASPAFFSYGAGSNLYVSAVHLDGTLVGDPMLVSTATQAHPNEIIELYVSGLAAAPGGTIVAPATFAQPVTVTAGSYSLIVVGAALVAAGEYQVNVQLPANIPAGTYPMTLTVPNGTTADSGVTVVLAVTNP